MSILCFPIHIENLEQSVESGISRLPVFFFLSFHFLNSVRQFVFVFHYDVWTVFMLKVSNITKNNYVGYRLFISVFIFPEFS